MTELEKVFALAIEREKEASEFYYKAASQVTDSNSKKVYMWLAQEETRHQAILNLELKNYRKGKKFVSVKSIKKMNLEAPIKTSELPKLTKKTANPDALAIEIVQKAIKAETEALKYYKDMAASTTDLVAKGVLNELAKIEAGHKTMLEQQCESINNCNAMFMLAQFETPLPE